MTKQHLQSLYQVGTRSTSPPQVVMTPKYLWTLPFSSLLSRNLISAATGYNCLVSFQRRGQYRYTFFLGHSHASQEKTINRQYTPYYSECLEIIFFPLARPVLNLHFTISSKSGSNPHKSSSLKPHIQIPGFRNFGRIVQSRHWEGVMIEEIMVRTTWSQQESSESNLSMHVQCRLLEGSNPSAH